MQDTIRSPALDSYFAYTANLGTHTFFMIFLPIQFWCGYTSVGRAYVGESGNLVVTHLTCTGLSLCWPLEST
jgi:hypothetical protein